MVTAPLDLRYMYKRDRLLERKKGLTESVQIPDLSEKCNKDFYRIKVESFLDKCSSYEDAIQLLEALYTDGNFELLESSTQKVIDNIIPMIETSEFVDCIDYINSANIGDINKDRLTEAVQLYKRIERIRGNHNNLSSRFNLSNTRHYSPKDFCSLVCEMVDTYTTPKSIKFNIALEEIAYLGFINGHKLSDDVIVENVLNYFLLLNDNSEQDIASYKKSIENSKILSENARDKIPYLYQESDSLYWKDRLNSIKVSPGEKFFQLNELALENCSNLVAFNSILSVIQEYCLLNEIEFNPVDLFSQINITEESSKNIKNMIDFINENHIENSTDFSNELQLIWETKLNDEVYSDNTKTPETFTSDEIDKFKMHNLLDDAKAVEEFLNQAEKTTLKNSPNHIQKNVEFPVDITESTILDNVDDNGYISLNIRSYNYQGTTESVVDLLNSSVKCLNNILYNRDSSAYYNLYEGLFEVCIRSKYKVLLTEAEENLKGFSASDKLNIVKIHNYTNILENIYNSQLPTVLDSLLNNRDIAANITAQEATLLYDILGPLSESSIDENSCGFVNEFISLCEYEANPQFDKIKNECSKIQLNEFNYYDDNLARIRFGSELLELIEAKNEKKGILQQATEGIKNTVKSVKDTLSPFDKKGKFKLSFNNLKLAWQGVKAKFKKASEKEQEFSRDLDIEFNHIIRSINDVMTPDIKKEILTGEINHSLSKTIKIGIGLAGLGALAGTAVVPVLGAIALFARSKYLTIKDKQMILDAVDVELKVLDRELQKAESDGSSTKYRQLLTIQKNLKRKKQEIVTSTALKGKLVIKPDDE